VQLISTLKSYSTSISSSRPSSRGSRVKTWLRNIDVKDFLTVYLSEQVCCRTVRSR